MESVSELEATAWAKRGTIPSMIYYPVPMYKQIAFQEFVSPASDLPATEALCRSVLSLPIHTEMDEETQEFIINGVRNYFGQSRSVEAALNAKKYFAHETAVIDEGCEIGEGVKIWHFSHVMPNCRIGDGCNIGQNVVVSPDVVLGKNVKVQNNVSIYTGVTCDDDVFLGPSMVFTNVTNPRSVCTAERSVSKNACRPGCLNRRQCDDRLRA